MAACEAAAQHDVLPQHALQTIQEMINQYEEHVRVLSDKAIDRAEHLVHHAALKHAQQYDIFLCDTLPKILDRLGDVEKRAPEGQDMQVDIEGRISAVLEQQEARAADILLETMWQRYAPNMEKNIWDQVAPILDDHSDGLRELQTQMQNLALQPGGSPGLAGSFPGFAADGGAVGRCHIHHFT